jgi:hypothetical protein
LTELRDRLAAPAQLVLRDRNVDQSPPFMPGEAAPAQPQEHRAAATLAVPDQAIGRRRPRSGLKHEASIQIGNLDKL